MTAGTQVGTQHAGHKVIEVARCALVVLSGDARGTESVIDKDVYSIGKASDSDLVLIDQTVSRTHCEIVHEAKGYLLRDLGSTNGTLLDGAEIREAYLKPGAIITVGKVELKVRPFSERIEMLPSDATSFGEARGKSVSMREIFGLLERLGPTDATMLLTGETGTGKDVLARSIHASSARKDKPFIVVDCGAVVGSLIESELFGHEKGSFTGATNQRQGAFELADGGTLFLDEIGELSLDLQPKLLRVLEQRSFRRVGGSREIRVDIRIIAATKRNLKMEVERGKFREDLYFRLAVVPIEVPPLRERREDVPVLVEELMKQLAGEDEPLTVSAASVGSLSGHDWPGNVRELRNVLERATYIARAMGQDELNLSTLPLGGAPQQDPSNAGLPKFVAGRSYRDTKAEWESVFEKTYVEWLLDRNDGNISAAAREADMDRKYLHKLAKKHGLHPADRK
ncbi:MAG: sigma 54-dependent Fis family transcriptional regulator [Deltaproteobacteria bacterium]|nr:sigma 54-dependent Fis family transcriptional regulator [Deltaproteobacteria bacterium]